MEANEADSSGQKRKLVEEEVIKSLETQISDHISQAAAQKNPREIRLKIVQADSFKPAVSAKKEVIEELERSIVKQNAEVKDCSN